MLRSAALRMPLVIRQTKYQKYSENNPVWINYVLLKYWFFIQLAYKLLKCDDTSAVALAGGRCCPLKLFGVYHCNAVLLWCLHLKKTLRVEIMHLESSLFIRGTLG